MDPRIALLDIVIIAAYFLFVLFVGIVFHRRATSSLENYFVSGRSLPWWIAGTSMVATTFAADTPLAVTNLVISHGVAGNWLWWNMVLSGMLTVFFFARLWRRAGILTDVEFVELRYSGKPARFLRYARALYLSIPINCMIIAWVTTAMAKVLEVTLGWERLHAVVISSVITVIYVTLSGLWGVVMTDFVQFIMAMSGCIALAYYSLQRVGGIAGLTEKLNLNFGGAREVTRIYPDFSVDAAWLPFSAFFVYIGIQWWASWYPGAEPGGGGYVAQRMLACKDEKHSLLATLWFNIAHYALRPWPWIIVALCAMVLFPELSTAGADPEVGFPRMMNEVLPAGWWGLLLVSFFAAYMSTLSTQLNWGASYLINDFYQHIVPGKEERHYTRIAQLATVLLLILGGITSMWLDSVKGAWELMLSVGAGTGMVFILRWYWWRINAWSEIAGMVASLVVAIFLQICRTDMMVGFITSAVNQDFAIFLAELAGYQQVVIVAVVSLTIWLLVTFLTPPEDEKILSEFYRKIRPGGPFWGPISEKCPDVVPDKSLFLSFLNWALGSAFIFIVLFSIGELIFQRFLPAITGFILALIILFFIVSSLKFSREDGSLIE